MQPPESRQHFDVWQFKFNSRDAGQHAITHLPASCTGSSARYAHNRAAYDTTGSAAASLTGCIFTHLDYNWLTFSHPSARCAMFATGRGWV